MNQNRESRGLSRGDLQYDSDMVGQSEPGISLRSEAVSDAEIEQLLDEVETVKSQIATKIHHYQQGAEVGDRLENFFDQARQKLERFDEIYSEEEAIDLEQTYEAVSSEIDLENNRFSGLGKESVEQEGYIGEEPVVLEDKDLALNRAIERLEYTLKGAEIVKDLY